MADDEKPATKAEVKPAVETPKTVDAGVAPTKEVAKPSETESVVEELQEKKVKKAFLDKFKLIKKPSKSLGEAVEIEVAKEATPEDAAEQIYRQLAEMKGNEYFVWRLKKKTLLFGLGILIALMWLITGGKWGIERYIPRLAIWNPTLQLQAISQVQPIPSPTSEASPAAKLKIRVRDNSTASGSAQILANTLIAAGFIQTEVVDDHQSDYTGISIITKANNNEVRALINNVLDPKYPLASPSAELTADSDFDAVILFAPDLKLTPTKKPKPTPTQKIATSSATPRTASSSATLP